MKLKVIGFLLVICTVLSLTACGERIVPSVDPLDTDAVDSSNDTSLLPGDTDEDAEPFIITVTVGSAPYLPNITDDESSALKVRLSNGKSFHTLAVETDGTATFHGLDGDYVVTLLNVPDDYTYNPNVYIATNQNRHVSVELIPLTGTYGTGADMYTGINVSKTGVYRANIKSKGQVVYYRFTPRQAGRYCFESWVDISADMYNPKAELYTGTFAAWFYQDTLNDGGSSGSYTKNFKHIIEVTEEVLGNSYLIGVLVEGKDAVYPTFVDFQISYLGTADEEEALESTLICPQFIPSSMSYLGQRDDTAFLAWREELHEVLRADGAKFGTSTYTDCAIRIGGKRVFDQSYYKLYKIEDGGDGFYHVYDLEKYAANNGWGPILYAEITTENMFFTDDDRNTAFNVVEYNGNKALTLFEGTVNYKLFIEGYDSLIYSHSLESGPYFCTSACPCYQKYEAGHPGSNDGLCTVEDNCQDCLDACRHVPEQLKYQKGYADIVNEDGRAPVTEELKIFLQGYSENQRLFSDGNGWVETYEPRYDAYEDSQWLFACGYYSD